MNQLLADIKRCRICHNDLPFGANPILRASRESRVIIIGQAPGTRVHATGIPWNDPSGNQLRKWMGTSVEQFYNVDTFAIVPMGFCYPGKGKSGDLPPRKECAPQWHDELISRMPGLELKLLIGQYAINYYLGSRKKKNLTETVRAFEEYLPNYLVLPHPSPRNRYWLIKNPWFESEVIPILQERIASILNS